MILNLPWPNPKLFPNRSKGKHFSVLSTQRKKQRADAHIIAEQHTPVLAETIPITLIFEPPTNHRRDLDNCLAAMKAALDGIADAWGVDDSRFRPITIDFGEKVKGGNVKIIVNNLTQPIDNS